MSRSMAVFSAESGTKGVAVTNGTVEVLNTQLTTDSQESRLAEEIFSVVDLSLLEWDHLLLFNLFFLFSTLGSILLLFIFLLLLLLATLTLSS